MAISQAKNLDDAMYEKKTVSVKMDPPRCCSWHLMSPAAKSATWKGLPRATRLGLVANIRTCMSCEDCVFCIAKHTELRQKGLGGDWTKILLHSDRRNYSAEPMNGDVRV
jgi:hypothetical protein